MKQIKLENDSLTERVFKELRREIITGEISGGTRLVESVLAVDMGVSRTPIREALQRLAQEGLVYPIPRAGYIVEDMSEEDIQDLFATRMAIEHLVAKWALPKITDEELDLLKRNLDNTDKVLKTGHTEKMIDLDIEFHHIIYRASRSRRLYQICKTLSDYTFKYRAACIHLPEIAKRAREDHFKIYKAIQTRDHEKLEESVDAHLLVVKQDILDFLKREREAQFLAESI